MLTLAQFVLTKEEKRAFKAAPGTAVGERCATWRKLLGAASRHARGDGGAKLRWYKHMCDLDRGSLGGGGGPAGCAECGCGCGCSHCRGGYCLRCGACACKLPRLLGHCFGLMEQFFLLLPAHRAASPLHFSTCTEWTCAACDYTYAASAPTLQLPLLLSAADLDSLLHAGVEREVGALVAAHLGANPYRYGLCPQCGGAELRAAAARVAWTPLLLVELGRPAGDASGGAASALPWRLKLAPTAELRAGGESARYEVAAVVYNDGAHWWADLRCAKHFKGGERGSYRYDGLEAGGTLRYAGRVLTLTSEPRLISFVLYRRVVAV